MNLHSETYTHTLMYLLYFIVVSFYCPFALLLQVHVLEDRTLVKKQVELYYFNDFFFLNFEVFFMCIFFFFSIYIFGCTRS